MAQTGSDPPHIQELLSPTKEVTLPTQDVTPKQELTLYTKEAIPSWSRP